MNRRLQVPVGRERRYPDVGGMLRWLQSERVITAEGDVLSWWSPLKTGFPYAEAAGLWLSSFSAQPSYTTKSLLDRVAERLCSTVIKDLGAGKAGRVYLFDSCIVLSGLISYREKGGSIETDGAVKVLLARAAECISKRCPVIPEDGLPSPRWSTSFGPHLIKAAIALHRMAELRHDKDLVTLADTLVACGLEFVRGPRLLSVPGRDETYMHSMLYACEGLLWLVSKGRHDLLGLLFRFLDFAARVQGPDGGIPAFADDSQGWGGARADATAQAARLWLAVDPVRWQEPVRRALAFLASCQTEEGGIRYYPGSEDVNTWATLFALQAVLWLEGRANPAEIF